VPPSPTAAPDGGDSALAAVATSASLTRLTRLAWAVLALGVGGAVALIVTVVAAARADADLRATGVHTSGTVLHVDRDSRDSPGGAEIVFWDGRADQMTYVYLDSYADDYTAGQHVQVVYDPADWDRITVDDVQWTPPSNDLAQGLLILPAGVGLLLGSMLLQVRSRTRRLLAGRVWTPVRVEVIRGRGRLFLTEDAGLWESYLAGPWPAADDTDRPDHEPHARDAWWVTDGRRAVFAPDQGGPLVLTHRG
jgi:hypothetical protein